MHRDGTLLCADAFEEKHRRHTKQTEKRQHAEVVDVRQHHRLAAEAFVRRRLRQLPDKKPEPKTR